MLADEIAEGRFTNHPGIGPEGPMHHGLAQRTAAEAIIISADNVWDYTLSKEEFHISDYPCVAPPFRSMVIESHDTKEISRWCFVLTALEPTKKEWEDIRLERLDLLDNIASGSERWLIQGSLIFRATGCNVPCLVAGVTCVAGEDGRPLRVGVSDWRMGMEQSVSQWMGRCVHVGLLTISFMHCKNVIQRVVAPPPKLSKRHKERHGRQLFSYRVLEIESMKQVLRTEGRSDEVGLAKALHICRGHFKDYRERGLFGRNKGLYWWDQHARGSIEAGVAAKDYAVKAPSKGNQ